MTTSLARLWLPEVSILTTLKKEPVSYMLYSSSARRKCVV